MYDTGKMAFRADIGILDDKVAANGDLIVPPELDLPETHPRSKYAVE